MSSSSDCLPHQPTAPNLSKSSDKEQENREDNFRRSPVKPVGAIAGKTPGCASEVGGGWLVWQSIRSGKPWWWGLLGSVTLVVYGFIPTLQPVDQFGRTFAAYGGFFIVYSYGWGWLLDHEQPDTGDFAGAGIALAGVCICWFWPRKVRTD
ncbi:MAG: UPF0060-domain-containing protein [Trebouxia sp. A1-2]|nr:MAG: UPF0060-domain-containing protein [Trebouxia sp. A1-2]